MISVADLSEPSPIQPFRRNRRTRAAHVMASTGASSSRATASKRASSLSQQVLTALGSATSHSGEVRGVKANTGPPDKCPPQGRSCIHCG